ncbi:hypothetical protein CFN58_13230 [Pseudomonas avellanae]|uniref:DUF1534 domain-containing protein n=1 Tax=Pseudomonas avellanae TaxID=46257 RepID=A0A261WK60_9PSED|nr:hypothetical protein CFN58_13230 [Pseudomonas avellanae]PHZ41550.1 DUF1534 domain-containing protein [Pseudomonas syringae pv. actinidiae]PIB88958.1 DUF1534 domain-containing protein [Pseudomonas syringae pv. actinidiae]PIH64123.1 DUF1534 domain-containing protein [Pseudomonas syringae pv. actinidiae]PIH68704.1 DUF1534 domain-containing protein [Pseudomonas syringae pv. actinidiae]
MGVIDQHHLAPASGSGKRTHQTCGASANDYNVSNGHSVFPRLCKSICHDRSHAPRGNASRDALRHICAPHHLFKIGRRASRTASPRGAWGR